MTRALIFLALAGCNLGGTALDIGEYAGVGATPGGAQDIGYARDIIANGGVPHPDDIPVEGLLSEHDLPIEGRRCDELFCVRPAVGTALSLNTGQEETWVQLGMTSGLPAPLQRPPADIVVVIDHSASMSIDMDETEIAVANLVDQMGRNDRLGVIAFNGSVKTLHALGQVTDAQGLKQDIRALSAQGGWQVDDAMQAAFDEHRRVGNDRNRLRRVILLTCGYPGTSGRAADAMRAGADERIGTSIYGVLLGWDRTLADFLGDLPGGSYHYLQDLPDVTRTFLTGFDHDITPLAYDLTLDINLERSWTVEQMYGLPGADDTSLDVATVFAKEGGGGIFGRLTGHGSDLGEVELDYDAESSLNFEGPAQPAVEPLIRPDETPLGVQKGVFLVNQAERMAVACRLFHDGKKTDAIEVLDELHDHLVAEQAELQDPALDAEIQLVHTLRKNVSK